MATAPQTAPPVTPTGGGGKKARKPRAKTRPKRGARTATAQQPAQATAPTQPPQNPPQVSAQGGPQTAKRPWPWIAGLGISVIVICLLVTAWLVGGSRSNPSPVTAPAQVVAKDPQCTSDRVLYHFETSKPKKPTNKGGKCIVGYWLPEGRCVYVQLANSDTPEPSPYGPCPEGIHGVTPMNTEYAWAKGAEFRAPIELDLPPPWH